MSPTSCKDFAARVCAEATAPSPLCKATNETVASTLDSAAKTMDAENDILVMIFTSHGSRGGLAVKSGPTQETLSPWLLNATLK